MSDNDLPEESSAPAEPPATEPHPLIMGLPGAGDGKLPGICCECLGIDETPVLDENDQPVLGEDGEPLTECLVTSVPEGSIKLWNAFLEPAFKPYEPALPVLTGELPALPDIPAIFEPPELPPPVPSLPPIPAPPAPPGPPGLPAMQAPAFELPDISPGLNFLIGAITFPIKILVNASLSLLDVPPQPPSPDMIKIPSPLPIPDPNGGPPPPMAGCFAEIFNAVIETATGGAFSIIGEIDAEAVDAQREALKQKLIGIYGEEIQNIRREKDEENNQVSIVSNGQGEGNEDGGPLPEQFTNAMAGTGLIDIEEEEEQQAENAQDTWVERSAATLADIILGPEPPDIPEEGEAPAGGGPAGVE